MEFFVASGYGILPTAGGTTGTIESAASCEDGGSFVASPPISFACSA
jgi:hypothetical protein